MRTRAAWLPLVGLFVLAPWMAEFSWGGLGVVDLAIAMLFLGPLYGGAAILIREVARRTGRGWPTILVLGLAFGLLQAGVVDQSLFNPAYDRYDFQHPAHLPGLGVSAYYLIAFVVGHAVTSIGIPIALVETFAVHRGDRPWLGRTGLAVVAGIYVLASVVNHLGVKEEEHFQASAPQVGFTLVVVTALLVVAFRLRGRAEVDGRVPPALVVGAIALVAHGFYLIEESWAGVVVALGVITAVAAMVVRWSRRRAWGRWHAFALAGGAALGGAWAPFVGEPYDDSVAGSTELVNDVIAAAIPVLLVTLAAWRLRRLDSATPRALGSAVMPAGSHQPS